MKELFLTELSQTRFFLIFLGIGLLFSLIEGIWPARKIEFRKVLPTDLLAGAVSMIISFTAVAWVAKVLFTEDLLSFFQRSIPLLPILPRVILTIVLTDFVLYGLHRLMHTKYIWRTHQWHHSAKSMYWLAGKRASVMQQIFYLIMGVVSSGLQMPLWYFVTAPLQFLVWDNYMHMNVTWRSNWLEWAIITPRYHHIHHSTDPRLYGKNLGLIFTFWDRVFGTYFNPDDLPEFLDGAELEYGLNEKLNPIRLAIGI